MTSAYESLNEILEKSVRASAVFSQLDQEHTDRITRAVYKAAMDNRVKLAKMAKEETGMGKWEDKVLKNVIASQMTYEDIKSTKTVGIISRDEKNGIIEIAQPMGPVLAITPFTNPTSTVIFDILICLKTRNPIVITPHEKAAKCSIEAARICYEAALAEDAPEDCIQWVEYSSRKLTPEMMSASISLERLSEEAYSRIQLFRTLVSNRRFALILVAAGSDVIQAAQSSGNPTLGASTGNAPVFIERTADIPFAINQILISRTFDYGTSWSGEQAVVVEKAVAGEIMEEFKKKKGYFMTGEEVGLLEKIVLDKETGKISMDIIGKPAFQIAGMAGFEVPEDTAVLIAPQDGIGDDYPLSGEIIAPILTFHVADDFQQAINACIEVNFSGGVGHTAGIFSNDEEKIKEFSLVMNAGRILVNMPSTQGALGGIYNTLHPSMMLGCGAAGKNITTDNITVSNLLNIQRITLRRLNERYMRFNKEKYLDESINAVTIEKEYNQNY